MEFSDLYRKYASDIQITALSQRVPGLDHDDIVSEMMGCLWKAWMSYVPCSTTFGSYWWSLWLNRRSDLTSMANAMKRPRITYVDEHDLLDRAELTNLVPGLTGKYSDKSRLVWVMIAQGYKPGEIMERCHLSRRAYYDIIEEWRTGEVWSLLSTM